MLFMIIIGIFSYVLATIESNIYMALAAKIAMKEKRFDIRNEDMHLARDAYKEKNEFSYLLSEKDKCSLKWIRRLRLSAVALFVFYAVVGITVTKLRL